jgi:hypothetical protein
MARQAKQPFRNREKWVADVYRWLFQQNYTAERAYKTFQRLRRKPDSILAKVAGFPAGLPPSPTPKEDHSLDTVKAFWKALRREAECTNTLPVPWDFLADPVDHLPQVLAAIAAWQSSTGERWPVTLQEADTLASLFTAAPDLPPLTAASLTHQVLRWSSLPAQDRWGRLTALRDFLGFAPWRGEDARRRYQEWTASGDRIELTEDGSAVYTVTLSGTASGGSAASASLTVGRDDEDAGH